MAVDLKMDMGSIIKGFIAKQSGGSTGMGGRAKFEAYKIAIMIFAAVLVFSILYISLIYLPMKEKNTKKLEELNKILEMKNQLTVLDGQINALKKKLDKSKEEYIESLAHFGNSEDLGALYQTVSTLASKYNLVVLNVKEVAVPVAKAQPMTKAKATEPAEGAAKTENKTENKTEAAPADPKAVKKDAAPAKPKVDVKEIKVDVEIKGHYGEYIKFKEDLALAEILLKINTESIMVKNEATDQGSIYVKLNLSTYAIDKKPFQGVITEKAQGVVTEKTQGIITEKTNEKTN